MSRSAHTMITLVGCLAALAGVNRAAARDWYVNVQTGRSSGDGSQAAPLALVRDAVKQAQSGDRIHLLPPKSLIRQVVSLTGKTGLTILGHDCTITASDPLPRDGWERVGENLSRRRLPRTPMDRHLLIVDGRMERMGRSPSVARAFPKPEKLRPGQFCWEQADEKTGWLYVCGPVDKLEWSVRLNALQTSGKNRDITIEDLNTCHALNDGFNIHGDCRGLHCRRITGYDNFDEGFSAHDTCECWIEDGRFWGNDNAVADVNEADTFYTRCEFRDSVSVEVLFQGGKHSLDDCRIYSTGKNALTLSATTVGKNPPRPVPAECQLRRCRINSAGKPRGVVLSHATASFEDCTLENVAFTAQGRNLTVKNSTLDGQPLAAPTEAKK